MWGSEPSQQWESFFGIIILKFVGHPPGSMRFDFIMIVPLLPFPAASSLFFPWSVILRFRSVSFDGARKSAA